MKKIIKGILCVLLLLSMVGCDDTEKPESQTYTITFLDHNGNLLSTKEVASGKTYQLTETAPEIDGQLFVGWTLNGEAVEEVTLTKDIELVAFYIGIDNPDIYTGPYTIYTEELEQYFEVGEKSYVRYNISPEGYEGPIEFECSDPSILEVYQDGTCEAISAGVTYVRVYIEDSYVEFAVEVFDPNASTTDTTFQLESEEFVHVSLGKTSQIKVNVVSDDENTKKLVYTSDNPEVATVNSKGVITAKDYGSTVIRVSSKNDLYHIMVFVYVNGAKLRVSAADSNYKYKVNNYLDLYLEYTTYTDGKVQTVNGWGNEKLKMVIDKGPEGILEMLGTCVQVVEPYSGDMKIHFEIGKVKSKSITIHLTER